MAFKMKGSPMHRNYGHPFKAGDEKTFEQRRAERKANEKRLSKPVGVDVPDNYNEMSPEGQRRWKAANKDEFKRAEERQARLDEMVKKSKGVGGLLEDLEDSPVKRKAKK